MELSTTNGQKNRLRTFRHPEQTLNIGIEGTVHNVVQRHFQLPVKRGRPAIRERGDDPNHYRHSYQRAQGHEQISQRRSSFLDAATGATGEDGGGGGKMKGGGVPSCQAQHIQHVP